ncbi:hypothetical protein [Tautonia sociabilis]|uniref:Uncharacterized protein n=1 Tax=Tautonia sociabilis TaxID=2080755 RepID=A0A432MD51_9BACT|nr:hypothetical protein [Tautonia sociabilis]RUL81891.1 hypothetical protein TsocGM_24285 [Tautonia sociabilis]
MQIRIAEVVVAAHGQLGDDVVRRELTEVDTDLTRVIAAWPTLPGHLRRAILTLVDPDRSIEGGD